MSTLIQHRLFLVVPVTCCIILSLVTTMTTSLPMKPAGRETEPHGRQKREVTRTNCTQPPDVDAMFQRINSQLSKTHFLQKAVSTEAISIPAGEAAHFLDGDPNESRTCPKSLTRDGSAPIAHRSLCPFYFDILQLAEGYYPPTLKWAKCKCQQCVENSAYGCEAIKTDIAVLKPVGCFEGMQKYEEQVIEVNTACACAFKGSLAEVLPVETTTLAWGVN